jgi:hypothetical protein
VRLIVHLQMENVAARAVTVYIDKKAALGDAPHRCPNLLQTGQLGLDEAGLEQEILSRLAGDDELVESHHIHP